MDLMESWCPVAAHKDTADMATEKILPVTSGSGTALRKDRITTISELILIFNDFQPHPGCAPTRNLHQDCEEGECIPAGCILLIRRSGNFASPWAAVERLGVLGLSSLEKETLA